MNTVAQAGTDDDAKRAIEEAQELLKFIEERKLWKLVAILKRKAVSARKRVCSVVFAGTS